VIHPDIARHLHEQRLRDGRRHWPVGDRLASSPAPSRRRPGRALRRALGRTIVRIGTAIEAEPRQPVASR
jgi:hypothetical protein